MEPIQKFYSNPKRTNDIDWSTKTREELIKHLKAKYYDRGYHRGIACPLPNDIDSRSKNDLIKLARHYYI